MAIALLRIRSGRASSRRIIAAVLGVPPVLAMDKLFDGVELLTTGWS